MFMRPISLRVVIYSAARGGPASCYGLTMPGWIFFGALFRRYAG